MAQELARCKIKKSKCRSVRLYCLFGEEMKRKGRKIGGGGDFLGRSKRDTIGGYKLGDNVNDKNPRLSVIWSCYCV